MRGRRRKQRDRDVDDMDEDVFSWNTLHPNASGELTSFLAIIVCYGFYQSSVRFWYL